MAKLWHDRPHDLPSPVSDRAIHRGQKVDITNDQAKTIALNGVWHIELDSESHKPRRSKAGKVTEVAGKMGERR